MIRHVICVVFATLLGFVSPGSHAATFPKLAALEQSLDLTAGQKVQFDTAVAATQRAVLAVALRGMALKLRAQAEFGKDRPDLAALAELREANAEATRPLREAARDEWLKLYGMLSNDQVAKVKAHLAEKLEQLDALHEFMLRLLLGRGTGIGG